MECMCHISPRIPSTWHSDNIVIHSSFIIMGCYRIWLVTDIITQVEEYTAYPLRTLNFEWGSCFVCCCCFLFLWFFVVFFCICFCFCFCFLFVGGWCLAGGGGYYYCVLVPLVCSLYCVFFGLRLFFRYHTTCLNPLPNDQNYLYRCIYSTKMSLN